MSQPLTKGEVSIGARVDWHIYGDICRGIVVDLAIEHDGPLVEFDDGGYHRISFGELHALPLLDQLAEV